MSASRGGDHFTEQNPDLERSLEDSLAVQGTDGGPEPKSLGGATAAEGSEEGVAANRESHGDAFPAKEPSEEELTPTEPGSDTSVQPT